MITENELGYKIRPYEREDEARVLDLLRICLSSDSNQWDGIELWRWKHLQNAFGPSYVLLAETNTGEVIGVRALMRWKFSVNDSTIDAVRPVDTATHPDYRRWGIFTRLTGEAMADLEAQGVHLVFNTPNSNSLAGYIKMGWVPLGKHHPQIKLVQPVKAMAKLGLAKLEQRIGRPSQTNSMLTSLPPVGEFLKQPGVSTLLDRGAVLRGSRLCTEKSLNYLKWRYEDHVSVKYHAVWENHHGEIAGSLIFRTYERSNFRGTIIEELLLSEPDTRVAARLIGEAVRASSADMVTANFSPASFQRFAVSKNGFHYDPRKKNVVVVRKLNSMSGIDPGQVEAWEYSMGDLEFL